MSDLVPFNSLYSPDGGGCSSLFEDIWSLVFGKQIVEARVVFTSLRRFSSDAILKH